MQELDVQTMQQYNLFVCCLSEGEILLFQTLAKKY